MMMMMMIPRLLIALMMISGSTHISLHPTSTPGPSSPGRSQSPPTEDPAQSVFQLLYYVSISRLSILSLNRLIDEPSRLISQFEVVEVLWIETRV